MKVKRRKSRQIKIGNVKVGGNNPIVVQSMVKAFTSDLSVVLKEIGRLQKAGCQIVRVAVKDDKDAAALKKIKQRISIPLVADIHFDKNLAIKAVESGVDKIRLNPGNIYKRQDIREIVAAVKQAHIPIRIGVNSGSVEGAPSAGRRGNKNQVNLMVQCALDYVRVLESFGFYETVISLKSSDIFDTIQANEELAESCDYPIHLGVTASGLSSLGLIKSAVVIGRLLFLGIGDTIRISLTDTSLSEVKAAWNILDALNLGKGGPEIISCPTCGRCEVDLINIVQDLDVKLKRRRYSRPVSVAVMGCVVNGPGEAKAADLGIAFGRKEGLLFSRGNPVKKVSSAESVAVLLKEIEKLSG